MIPVRSAKRHIIGRFLLKFALMISLLMFSFLSRAQDYSSYRIIDSLTYHYYQTAQWSALAHSGKQALRYGHDYAYLRMRLGIAHYMSGQYRLAAPHFEKALEFDSRNTDALLLLQNSYRWAGMESSAANLAKRFPQKHLQGSKQNFLKEVSVFSGRTFSRMTSEVKNLGLMEPEQNYAEINANGDSFYINAGLKFSPVRHLVWHMGFTGLQLRKHQLMLHRYADTIRNQYILRQNQFYINLPFSAGKNREISPALSIVSVNQNPVALMYDTLSGRLTPDTIPIRFSNYLLSVRTYRHFTRFGTGTSLSYSNLNNSEQIQAGLFFDFFPFGNLNLYSNSALYLVHESKELRPIFKQSLGFKVCPRLWMQLAYTGGDIKNMNFENGLIIYNSTATLKSRFSADAFVLLSRRLSLQLQYAWQNQFDEYLESVDFNTFAKKTYDYTNHQLMLGLKWKL